MKKIIKKVLLGLVFLIAIYGVGRFIDVSYGSLQFVKRQPYLVSQTQTSMAIKWQTPKSEVGKVLYGLSPDTLINVLNESETSKKHFLTLGKLNECTQYYYKVISPSLIIDNNGRHFRTLCKEKQTQRLWVIGDSGKVGANQREVYAQLYKYIKNDYKELDMWLLLGDNAYPSGTQKQFNKKLFKPFKELVKRYTPWAVAGNHDARRWAFYDIFDFPTNAEAGGVASLHEEFYSVEDANLHLIVLDSETISRAKDGDMAEWLRRDLRANKKPWVIVAFHTPPYSDGGHKSDSYWDSRGRLMDMRETFVPIFDEFGVDLVLSGHSHGYERSKLIINHLGKSDTFTQNNILQDRKTNYIKSAIKKKNSGTIYQVCGSSAKLDGATYNHPALPYSLEEMGSLIIELTPTTLTSKFLNINGKIADEFTITKTIRKK
ncbi:metallophosphoesterase family protein [Sulfurimonas sp. SAG-AH-194-C21]|nr:metallophosphoesterase family protein [Sulfurimonas sp. SAG-AH-194-C21]MDF1884084.1 metallophosphoesterase family protein [Sulfurimonas sp. SAG-AH-194-C21]